MLSYKLKDKKSKIEELNSKGFCKVSSVLDNIEEVKSKIDALQPIHWDDNQLNFKRYKCLFNRDPYWIQFIDNPKVLSIVEPLLGKDCHIIGQTAWKTEKSYVGCPLHTDYLFFHQEGLKYNPFIITAHFFFQDIKEEHGPTGVIPCSHLANSQPTSNTYQGNLLVPFLCKAGDVLLFRSEIWHSGGACTETRYLLQVHYASRIIAQRFHPYTEFQYKTLSFCNETQARLLGKHTRSTYD